MLPTRFRSGSRCPPTRGHSATVERLLRLALYPAPLPTSLLQILRRRGVARIDRILQELVLLVGPELADVGIGLDDGVDVFAALLLHLADIAVADHVAELVEPYRAAQRVRHFRVLERLDEDVLVLSLAADRLERMLQDLAAEIGLGRVDARIALVVAADRLDEFFVDGIVELGRVPVAGDGAERIFAHLLQQLLVDRGEAAEDLNLVAVFSELLDDLESVRPGMAGINRVQIGLEL